MIRACLSSMTDLWPRTTRAWLVTLAVLVLALALILWRLSVPAANATEPLPGGDSAARPSVGGEGAAATGAPGLNAAWVEQINNSLVIYQANYPASNFSLYQKKLSLVQDALARGDRQVVRVEMNAYFKMLDRRAHGISEVAADELFNFARMITPAQEYRIAVPRSGSEQYGAEIINSVATQ